MSLLELQRVFRDEVAAADDGAAPSSTGMAVYRDAYRGRLLGALEVSFERTRQWAGEESFTAAACHYVLTVPPRGWTLDDYGSGFPALLAELFAGDPEVAELAWLEWHMQRAFAALDAPQLDLAALTDADWPRLRFTLAPGFAARRIWTNCAEIWQGQTEVHRLNDTALLVWRQDLSPRFRVTDCTELLLLERIAQGARLEEVAGQLTAGSLGKLLAHWLGEGLFSTAGP